MSKKVDEEMRSQYDFSDGIRGKHHKSYKEGTNVVLIAPELYDIFPNADTVNQALREYAKEHHLTKSSI